MNYIPLCRKCSKLPLVTKINENNPNIIYTQCDTKCNNEQEINLTKCSSLSEEAILHAFQCKKHGESSFSSFCKECRVHLCKRCKDEHDTSHKIVGIDKEIIPSCVLSQIDNAKYYINVELKKIKDDYIKKIEDAYQNCIKNNNALLNMLSTLCSFYEMGFPNYHIKYIFSKYYLCTNDTINEDNLVNFFKKYSIIKEEVSKENKYYPIKYKFGNSSKRW